jgi:hypothetical protein
MTRVDLFAALAKAAAFVPLATIASRLTPAAPSLDTTFGSIEGIAAPLGPIEDTAVLFHTPSPDEASMLMEGGVRFVRVAGTPELRALAQHL